MKWLLALLVLGFLNGKTSFDLVMDRFAEGKLDKKEYLDLLRESVLSTDKLPEEFRGVSEPCGTPAAVEAYRRFGIILLTRPTLSGPEYQIQTEHFIVHYTTSGEDACSYSYASYVADVAEYCWAIEVDSLGWDAPPPDYGLGGDDRYDIYIMYLSGGVMGYTQPEYSGPDPNQEDATSYIAIANNLSNSEVKATVSHEFNHACQLSYSYNEATWWMENCATWMEDVVYDDLDYYVLYLLYSSPNPLDRPDYPITSSENLYWYAGAIWPMFLSEYYDIDVPRQAWARMAVNSGEHTLQDINYVLYNYYSSNLWTALKFYAVWRYFTGDRSDGYHFEEGGSWPTATIHASHSTYPASTTVSGSDLPDSPGGCNYIEFYGDGNASLILNFDGANGVFWGAVVVGVKSSQPSDEWDVQLDLNYAFTDTFPFNGYTRIVHIPVVTDWYTSNVDNSYEYTADTIMRSPDIDVYPDIVEIIDTDSGFFYVINVGEAELTVYDISPLMTDWITGIIPSSFTVSPGDSQLVVVTIDTVGLDTSETGYLTVYSNDPDESYKVVQINVSLHRVICGDVNGDGQVTSDDFVYLGNYIFYGGSPPVSEWAVDVNGDGAITSDDFIYLGNYIFYGGAAPQCNEGLEALTQQGE